MKDVAGNETQEKNTLRLHVHIGRMDNHICRLFSSSLAEVDVGRGEFLFIYIYPSYFFVGLCNSI
ncbi:hypothetical protein TRIATDRAFT_260318 [Trichoderma atroviride IMI 206040]|uniref:Uncharacterized protein n=1 Tax=Hypocrea atroviridis (strain ATCC 20476 / IMI 206040) TaxID=452589 RepID=G9PBC0_HYPAI|nr:uncharacterized protein TRIATDRAFT_302985 [Trichoderma atroviride IMI 206040]EHK39668.1 hypothetical protein TRIATDRAFT_260318 [Trichoderma atroviride IMI 206040]